MLLGGEGEIAGVADAADLYVVVFIGAIGDVVGGEVGEGHQDVIQAGGFGLGLLLERGDFGLFGGDEGAEALELGIKAFGLGGPDLLGGGVALGLLPHHQGRS